MQDRRELLTPKAKKMKKKPSIPVISPPIAPKTKYTQPKQKATPKKKTNLPLNINGFTPSPNKAKSLTGSGSTEDYRVLRRKYLMLEEESFSLDKQLTEAEAESRDLEQEKSALLDQLVVLEGLVDPQLSGSRYGRI